MSALLTSSETRKAAWTLKNNKSLGMDEINVELIKYSPGVVYENLQKYIYIYKSVEDLRRNVLSKNIFSLSLSL